jgi:hypothetical protein
LKMTFLQFLHPFPSLYDTIHKSELEMKNVFLDSAAFPSHHQPYHLPTYCSSHEGLIRCILIGPRRALHLNMCIGNMEKRGRRRSLNPSVVCTVPWFFFWLDLSHPHSTRCRDDKTRQRGMDEKWVFLDHNQVVKLKLYFYNQLSFQEFNQVGERGEKTDTEKWWREERPSFMLESEWNCGVQ